LILLLFRFLRSEHGVNNYVTAAWITGIVVMVVGFVSVIYTDETFGKDMNFLEK